MVIINSRNTKDTKNIRDTNYIRNTKDTRDTKDQGVFSPAGVWVFPARNIQNPQEILTKTLIIEQLL